ncbi:putative pectinesterase [Helianthus annuus]|uniref:pectinesterase n=1 Tax=Helianthus annuus TaxID=4232 RepID=A0A251RUI1_HELAN|nr:pectinesterase inhibitor 11 [Helianthus annuus]KAF5757433.1 putative pectinesterase [Helianthus annuus]KAJ0435831.1 putative pectinesterase [Helianthus annuus]KAJ0449248.1 putative pectinesterase [Helianthus annuus]KAJ0637903.1 putative pectinesterase [Helianthus annuus]KAJ0828416.1 putative pectinesterase [Helianthus annuus]
MKTQIPIIIFLLSTTLTTITTTTTTSNPLPPSPSPQPNESNDKDFIRTSCKTTLYPQTCFTSLSGYSVQQDPGRLARAAIGVTLFQASHMAKYVANITRHADYSCSPRAAAAVHDCYSVFRDAVDEIRGSLSEMRRLGGSHEGMRFHLSNVQTWMSAALTNVETCTDGFDDVADDVKTDVCERAVKVKEVTSNALALINSFASSIQTP